MGDSASLTVELPGELNDLLARLADRTHRSAAALVADAVAEFVARELEMIGAIEEGLEDFRAGRVVPHAEAVAEGRAALRRFGLDGET
jgi:predicted transcriptional regulator